jgi:hypothetical protein
VRHVADTGRRVPPGAVMGTLALVGALAVAASCAACGATGSAETLNGAAGAAATPLPPVPSAPIPSAGPQGAAGRLVLGAYRGYWAAQRKALDSGNAVGAGIERYATGQALSDSLDDLVRLMRTGLVMSGAPTISPVVTSVQLQSNPQTATLYDCLDVSGWHQVTVHDHRDADPAQRLTRYVLSVQARTVGSTWMISAIERRTDLSC